MMMKSYPKILIALLFCMLLFPSFRTAQAARPPKITESQLLTEVQRRAVLFFWEQSDSKTGLTSDRASNRDSKENPSVASIASTGYALSSLPIAVKHGWIAKDAAYKRVLLTLRYLYDKFPNEHGWYFHFVDRHTGARVWKCELSSIDTALLLIGALCAGQYWQGTEVDRLANAMYDRVDWTWMRTNGGTKTSKLVLAMGWKPESGFLESNWDRYCELMYLYLLGLGANNNPLPKEAWAAWQRNVVEYKSHQTLAGGPIFLHQMAHTYYDFKGQRDALGWDYWVSSLEAMEINRQFCLDHAAQSKTYAQGFWGLNASDGPGGYRAYAPPDQEDGTVSPTGVIAAVLFTPESAVATAQAMYERLGDRIWGRYGFADAFNLDRDWFDTDVIGIDLGMALLAIEDVHSGLPWKLLATHPATIRALKLAGFHSTHEHEPDPLHKEERGVSSAEGK